MDQDLLKRLDVLEQKIDHVWQSVEKTRKYFLIIIWITILTFILPAIGLLFAIPSFLSTYSGLQGL